MYNTPLRSVTLLSVMLLSMMLQADDNIRVGYPYETHEFYNLQANKYYGDVADATVSDATRYDDDRLGWILGFLRDQITTDEYVTKIITKLGSGTANEVEIEDNYIENTLKLYVFGRRWNPYNTETIAADNWEYQESGNGLTPRHVLPYGAQLVIEYIKIHVIQYLSSTDGRFLLTTDGRLLKTHGSDDY
jgi:hypothetical protein